MNWKQIAADMIAESKRDGASARRFNKAPAPISFIKLERFRNEGKI